VSALVALKVEACVMLSSITRLPGKLDFARELSGSDI
jgi:hypothetical protein